MADRPCVRGCATVDTAFAVSVLMPVMARDKALICDRCYRSLRRHVEDAADVVGHLRSVADPMKAAVYDRVVVSSSRPDHPAPVAAVLIDAADSIVKSLATWVRHFTPSNRLESIRESFHGLDAGAMADAAYEVANFHVLWLLDAFEYIVNDAEVVGFAEAILTRHEGDPADWPYWSVADALGRWPLDDRERWATSPCPECECKTVRVKPPRGTKFPARFRCTTCEWERTERDDDGLWRDVFADDVPAASIPIADPARTKPHDPRWMTLGDAARLAGVGESKVRGWVDRGVIRTREGRYWREDVQARSGALGVDRLLAAMDEEEAADKAA